MKTLLLILALVPSLALAQNCRHEADRNLDIPRAGAKSIDFDLASADVEIEGVPGLAGVEVRGRACASEEARLAEMTVEQRREGERIVVVAREGHKGGVTWFGNGYSGLRLKVRVPVDLAVKIDSASGDARVDHVAALDFNASSGDLVVSDVAGSVTVGVSSGDVRGDHIGPLTVRHTSSGDITVRDIRGDAHVGAVGSGDIRLTGVHGQVTLERAGSGDITLREVERDVTIGPIGSGDLDVDGVGGNLSLASRRDSDDIRYRHVAGKVSFGAASTQ
jgi:hypothetical protein